MSDRPLPFVFITGGCRSGKSAYAQRLAEHLSRERLYVATAVPHDEEMRERIRQHRQERGKGWRTFEAATGNALLAEELYAACRPGEAVLFDCLTLWAAGHMHGDRPPPFFADTCDTLLRGLWTMPSPVIMVSNEVGMGVVPQSAAGRAFRDMAGLAGQKAAALAPLVIMMVCGIPLAVKGELPSFSVSEAAS